MVHALKKYHTTEHQYGLGDIAYWVNFDTGEVNVTAMKDHMFYHSGMLRGMIRIFCK
jgi:hypothetical protein